MSIVFLGTSEFAAAILARLARSERHRPALVITRPDRPAGRGRRLIAPPVAERAQQLGIALSQPERVNDAETLAMISAAGTQTPGQVAERQTVIVCAFGALIKEPLLSAHELINVHPSLLPRWRGAAPLERALMAGDAQTGVAIMRLTAGLDDGPVCLMASEEIKPDDDYGALSERLQELGGELLLRALEERPPFQAQAQEGATYAEKITAEDRLLDPARAAIELERVVRALHPHIGARLELTDGTLLGVQRARLYATNADELADPPVDPKAAAQLGLHEHEGRLLLICSAGALELLTVKPAGGRAMDAPDYLRGHGQPGRR
ncbi:MAG TPA: methionyl-tRNA formyltransferase [Solirubrobacteraceae bacterium]